MADTAKMSRRNVSGAAAAPTGILVPNRVFIGGLPTTPSQHEIADLFSKYGVVVDVKIVPTENMRTKPYGFVTFQTAEEANKALQDTNIILRDRKLNVAAAYRKHSAQVGGGQRSGYSTPSTPGYQSAVYSTPSMERINVQPQSVSAAQQPEMWYTAQTPGPGGSVQNIMYFRNACGQYQYAPLPVSPIQHPIPQFGGPHGSPYWIPSSPVQPCYMVYDQSIPGSLGDSTSNLVTLTPPAEEASVLDESEGSAHNMAHATNQAKQEASASADVGAAPQPHTGHVHHQQPQQQHHPMPLSSQPVIYCPHHSCMMGGMSNHFARSCQFLAPSCYSSTPLQSSPSMYNSPYLHAPRRPTRLQRWNSLDANIGQSWSSEPWSRPSLDNSYSSEAELILSGRRERHLRAAQQIPCQLHGMYSPMCMSQEFNIWSQTQNQSHDQNDTNAAATCAAPAAVPNVSPASSVSSLSVNLGNANQSNQQEELGNQGNEA